VRNTVAHCRAISDDSLTILKGDLVVIEAAVNQFKSKHVRRGRHLVDGR
jgi:hypothetical protein